MSKPNLTLDDHDGEVYGCEVLCVGGPLNGTVVRWPWNIGTARFTVSHISKPVFDPNGLIGPMDLDQYEYQLEKFSLAGQIRMIAIPRGCPLLEVWQCLTNAVRDTKEQKQQVTYLMSQLEAAKHTIGMLDKNDAVTMAVLGAHLASSKAPKQDIPAPNRDSSGDQFSTSA